MIVFQVVTSCRIINSFQNFGRRCCIFFRHTICFGRMLKFLSVTTNCKPEWRLARNTSQCLVFPLDIPARIKHCWNVLLIPDKHNNDCAYANGLPVAAHCLHAFELNTSRTMAVCFLGWRTLLYGCLGFYSDWLNYMGCRSPWVGVQLSPFFWLCLKICLLFAEISEKLESL